MDPVRATRRAVSIGQAFATLFMLVGMLWNIWLTMIGFFLFIAAQLESVGCFFSRCLKPCDWKHYADRLRNSVSSRYVRRRIRKSRALIAGRFPGHSRQRHGRRHLETKILQALRAEGNGYVQAVMNRIFEVAQKKESLASAFRKLDCPQSEHYSSSRR